MKELIKEMRVVVDGEVARAMDRYGRHYASNHEGYGVLAEEIWEAEKEVRDFRLAQTLILKAIHENDTSTLNRALESIHQEALRAACECAQVAAVAIKMMESLKLSQADVREAERKLRRANNPFSVPPRDFDGPLGGL